MNADNKSLQFFPRLPRGSKYHPRHTNFAGSLDGILWRKTKHDTWVKVREPIWLDNKAIRPLALVLECFVPKPSDRCKVGFRDGDRTNHDVKNLVWVSIGYPDELRKLALDRVAAGQARRTVSDELEVPYRTICEWTKHLP